MKYRIYEIQCVETWHKYYYEVEAKNEQEARVRFYAGELDPEGCGEWGDPEYGDSGIAVVPDGDDRDAWEEAADKLAKL